MWIVEYFQEAIAYHVIVFHDADTLPHLQSWHQAVKCPLFDPKASTSHCILTSLFGEFSGKVSGQQRVTGIGQQTCYFSVTARRRPLVTTFKF